MATNTDAPAEITVRPSAPGNPAPVNAVNQIAEAPDPRTIAANSMMPNLPPSGPTSSALSTITLALGNNQFQPRTYSSSTFFPYFGFLSLIVSELDRIMLHTYRFNQSNPDWHPLFTQIYYGIVFIVHIIRVRRTAGAVSTQENDFITWFESNFPIASLPIAGPLKHVFQAITVCSGPSKFQGNIFPDFPAMFLSRDRNFRFPDQYDWLNSVWPALPLLMDRLNDIARPATANWNTNDWERYHASGITHAYGVHLVAGNEWPFGLPGMTNIPSLPAQSMSVFRSSLMNMQIPPRLSPVNNNHLTSIAEYLRLANNGTQHSLWFPVVVGMMQRHAQFLKDSTNLASFSNIGLGASIPIITISLNDHVGLHNAGNDQAVKPTAAQPGNNGPPPTVDQPAGFSATRFQHFRIKASSKRLDLHLLAEQFALLSSVNVDFSNVGARGTHYDPLPLAAQLRTGPFWVYPDVKEHVEIDVLGQIVLFLVGAFHTDQRMTR